MPRIDRMVARDQLKPNPRNARTHSRKQIREIANSIAAFGFAAPSSRTRAGSSSRATGVLPRRSYSVWLKYLSSSCMA